MVLAFVNFKTSETHLKHIVLANSDLRIKCKVTNVPSTRFNYGQVLQYLSENNW
jgi:hypothetical protein